MISIVFARLQFVGVRKKNSEQLKRVHIVHKQICYYCRNTTTTTTINIIIIINIVLREPCASRLGFGRRRTPAAVFKSHTEFGRKPFDDNNNNMTKYNSIYVLSP